MKLPTSADDRLLIHEIYSSIQGESSWVGIPTAFVRTSACNLRCRWCDTPQAFTGGTRMMRADVLSRALNLNTQAILVTGGEPLLQPAVLPLLREFCETGKPILLETSGERDISQVDPRVHRIVDFKAPGSGESDRNRWANVEALTHRDEVKFVLADRVDYEWARAAIDQHDLASRAGHVLLSPVWNELDPKSLAQWILQDALPARLQVQLHKYLWGADATGV